MADRHAVCYNSILLLVVTIL